MPLRLVLIEDHQALREGLELLLGREGIEVLGTAGTAEEGFDLVENLDPDVALVDIRLGEDSGIALTAQLIDADPERRIVLYTGSSEIELLISGLDSGARGYALKDGTPSELVNALTIVAEGGTYVDPRLHPALLSRKATQTQRVALQARARDHGPARPGPDRGAGGRAALPLARDDQDPHPQRDEQAGGPHARARDRDRPARGLHLAADRNSRPVSDEDLVLDAESRRRLRHDLRTPLTIVAGFAEVLAGERPISDQDRREFAARIQTAAGEIRRLIDEALE